MTARMIATDSLSVFKPSDPTRHKTIRLATPTVHCIHIMIHSFSLSLSFLLPSSFLTRMRVAVCPAAVRSLIHVHPPAAFPFIHSLYCRCTEVRRRLHPFSFRKRIHHRNSFLYLSYIIVSFFPPFSLLLPVRKLVDWGRSPARLSLLSKQLGINHT